MTERGLPSVDGSPACPFVAFEDERDERADRPDHRHRCFADVEPAPRALAHQEAYCLSSAFPVCPTFQDWARREAARARSAEAAGAAAATAGGPGDPPGDRSGPADEWAAPPRAMDPPMETTPKRNPPRDWAAPPPWATGSGTRGPDERSGPDPDTSADGADFRRGGEAEGRGLAGSAADRLASGAGLSAPGDVTGTRSARGVESQGRDDPSVGADPDLAGLVVGRGVPPPPPTGRRPKVSSSRGKGDRDRDRGRLPEHEHVQQHGPDWERPRRFEAYPQIKSPAALGGMPGVPRVVVLAGALVIAAVALFFLPALLGVGGDEPTASPSPTAAVATPTPVPTPVPAPTPQVYVIKSGDTLSRIAREFGITLEQLLEANQDTITNPDRITVGDEIIIPTPPPDEVGGGTPAP